MSCAQASLLFVNQGTQHSLEAVKSEPGGFDVGITTINYEDFGHVDGDMSIMTAITTVIIMNSIVGGSPLGIEAER